MHQEPGSPPVPPSRVFEPRRARWWLWVPFIVLWLALDVMLLRAVGRPSPEPKWLELKHAGNARLDQKDYKGAESLYRQALAEADKLGPRGPKAAACLHNLSLALENQERYPAAEDAAGKALALSRRFPSPEPGALYLAVTNQAWLYVHARRYAPAAPLLKEAITLEDTYPRLSPEARFRTRWMLAESLRGAGRGAEARPYWQKALTLAPTDADLIAVRKDMAAGS